MESLLNEYEDVYNCKREQTYLSNLDLASLDNNYEQEEIENNLKPFSFIENLKNYQEILAHTSKDNQNL